MIIMAKKKGKYKINPDKKSVKKKAAKVEEVKKELKNFKTAALLDLRKLPDSLLQGLRKKLRAEGGKVYILKKAVITRVLKTDKTLASLEGEMNKPVALVLTNMSPYDVNKFFKTNKKKRAAKSGEEAPVDIVVPAGETDLPPGPALSELKSGGVNVQIKSGKIVVAKDSTVAKAGDKITEQKAKALQTLGVQPFEVTVNMLYGYDGQYLYKKEILDIDETLNGDLQASMNDAFNLSMNANYPTPANVELLLSEAVSQSMNVALNGDLYSSSTMEQLLSSVARQGLALSEACGPIESAKEKPKEEKAEPPTEAETPKEEKPAETPKEEKTAEKPEAKKAEEKAEAPKEEKAEKK